MCRTSLLTAKLSNTPPCFDSCCGEHNTSPSCPCASWQLQDVCAWCGSNVDPCWKRPASLPGSRGRPWPASQWHWARGTFWATRTRCAALPPAPQGRCYDSAYIQNRWQVLLAAMPAMHKHRGVFVQDVKLRTAFCLCHVLRIHAPESPYSQEVLQVGQLVHLTGEHRAG